MLLRCPFRKGLVILAARSTASSPPSSGIVSAKTATLPHGHTSYRFKGPAFSPRLRTVIRGNPFFRTSLGHLELPVRLPCTSTSQAAQSGFLPELPPEKYSSIKLTSSRSLNFLFLNLPREMQFI